MLVASGFELYGILKEKTTVSENIVENVHDLVAQLRTKLSEIGLVSNKQMQVCQLLLFFADRSRSGLLAVLLFLMAN